MEELREELHFSSNQVRERAQLILRLLLHDYSRFSVSTIDRFFQQIIRSFARDAGLQMGFRTELNHQMVMLQAIDRVILEMDMPGHESLKRWLLDFAEKKITEGKSWNISREINALSEEIFKEAYQSAAGELTIKLSDKDFMNRYLHNLHHIISSYEQRQQAYGEEGVAIIRKWDLDIQKDFNGGSRSKVRLFDKLANQEVVNEEHIDALVDNPDIWVRKANADHVNQAIEGAFNDGLNHLLQTMIKERQNEGRDYHTAQAILKNFYALGIINDVNKKIEEVSREQNLFLLSGTNHLLTRIIQEDEAPFIYERTGTRYAHYMIDEFQDTSTLQYANFKPLITNSLSEGHTTLLVGDVKQSIYRWRNSDWTLLANRVEENFRTFGTGVFTLDTNWRSLARVVHFNNSFFSHTAQALQFQLANKIPDDLQADPSIEELKNKIVDAYSDVVQQKGSNQSENGGRVSFQFFEAENKETFQEQATQGAITHIELLLANGFKSSEICVLVRKRDEGICITNALLSGDYHSQGQSLPVISNETLQLNSSPAVLFVINHLKFLQNPNDKVLETFIRLHLQRYAQEADDPVFDASQVFHNQQSQASWEAHLTFLRHKQQMPLYDLTDELVRLLPLRVRSDQGLFLQALLNSVNAFSNREPADLNIFLDEWEKTGQFDTVMVPESQEAIRVMTVHKSKGLEFRAVVMPFCNWDLDNTRLKNLLWCKPQNAPFNDLTLVPVNYERALVKSHFVSEYLEELLHQYIDNLTLIYVAFTRARESLAGFCQKKKNKELTTISDLLLTHLSTVTTENENTDGQWNEEEGLYLSGQFLAPKENCEAGNPKAQRHNFATLKLSTMETFSLEDRVEIHLESADYFPDPGAEKGPVYGKVMHRIFEKIETKEDLPGALKQMWFEGKINADEQQKLNHQMNQWLNHPQVKNWFNGTYKVLAEVSILDKIIRRPDRVMIGPDRVMVVDYKFGKSDAEKHQAQVRDYMSKIKAMGYPQVEGYLWYVPFGEVVPVYQQPQQGKLFG
jgi:ATP-dependent exoDNAse (exonuclease V) beta subunit